jgi:MFS family permease
MPFGLPGVFAARAFQGFGEACLYTGAAAWAVELAGVERSSRALGFVSTGIWGGITAGPVVGNWFGSFHSAAAFQTIAALTAFALLTRIPEDYKPAPHAGSGKWLRSHLILPGLAVGFVNVHYPVITGFLILHLANHGNSGRIALSTYAGLVLASRFFLGGLPDKKPPQYTFFFGISMMAVGLTILAFGPNPPIAILGAACLGFGFSFPWASVAATVFKRTPSTEHGSAVSVLSAFYDLFVGMSSFSAGVVANNFGYWAAFAMAVVALAFAAIAGRAVFYSRA